VLVTGGNKGIGQALCRQLVAERGFKVLLGSRDEARGAAAVARILQAHPECQGSIEALTLDVASDASVLAAAERVAGQPLYGIVNNAGLGFEHSMEDTLNVNVYGAKRVCEAFLPMLDQTEGRVVNTASASGPNFVNRWSAKHGKLLTNPQVTWDEMDSFMKDAIANPGGKEPYGLSKACVNAYTMLLAREHPHLKINAMSPGYILTDITRGMGATKSPEEGTKAALYLLMDELEGNGRYYGSDAVRSPIDRYRGPGDPPYVGP